MCRFLTLSSRSSSAWISASSCAQSKGKRVTVRVQFALVPDGRKHERNRTCEEAARLKGRPQPTTSPAGGDGNENWAVLLAPPPRQEQTFFTPSHAHHFLPLRSAVALVLLRPIERYVAAPAGARSLRGRADALGGNRDAVMPRSDGAALGEDAQRGRTTCGPVSGKRWNSSVQLSATWSFSSTFYGAASSRALKHDTKIPIAVDGVANLN